MFASASTLRQISTSVTMAASCLLVGFGVLYYQQLYDFKRWSEMSASQAISIFDQALDYSNDVNKKILELGDLSCDEIRPILRDAVATTPYVRSVNIMKNNLTYCSSYSGGKKVYIALNDQLKLVPGTPIMPTRGGLIIKNHTQDMAVFSIIDSIYIKILLGMAMHNNELLIQVGDAWIDMSGTFLDTAPNFDNMRGIHKQSERYSYKIYAGYTKNSVFMYLLKNNSYIVALLFLIATILSAYTWYRTGKPLPLKDELRRALNNNEFVPYLQPLVDGQTGSLVGAEVLVRWVHPVTGVINPDLFIPLAETSGLINEITSSLMQQVSTKLSAKADDLPTNFHLGFNISAQQCHGSDLLDDCKEFISHFPKHDNILFLELTERTLLEDDAETRHFFLLVKDMGIQLALDDFGTGQSSLAYIQQFNFDYLKIDKNFVSMINSDSFSAPILDMLITLSKSLNMRLVAEGIETEAQRDYLRLQGVELLQGYLFSRPIPIEQFIAEWLP